MNAYVKFLGCGCIALAALGCGSKGSDGDDDDSETGGTSGTGATGGSSGTAGSGTGGSAGSGTLPIMTTHDFTEAADVCPVPTAMNMADCWKLIEPTGAGTPTAGARMGMPSDPIPAEDIMRMHTTEDGQPDPGALEATIPYTMAAQYVSFGINFASVDLTNRTITARVKVVSGLGTAEQLAMAPGGTKIYAKSGMGYCYANGPYNNLGDMTHPIGEWQTITYNLARSPDYVDPACATRGEPFDPTDIREIGIQIDTSGIADAAETAVIRLDTVTY